MNILIFDQRERNLKEINDILIDMNYDFKIFSAPSADKSIKMLEENDIDLIISEIKNDGLKILEYVRKKSLKDISFIIFTDNSKEEKIIQAFNLGADRYIKKKGDSINKYNQLIEGLNEEIKKRRARKNEKQFKDIFENATVGMYRTTTDGKIIMANPALIKMLGYESLQDLKQRNLNEEGYEPGYSRSEFKDLMEKNGGVKGLESEWVTKDGDSIFIRESARVIRDTNGDILYYEGTVEDITDRKEAERKVKENKEKIEKLHRTSSELETCQSEDEIFSLAVKAAEDILDFDICSFSRVEKNKFIVKERTSGLPDDGYLERNIEDGGIDTKTYQNQKSYLIKNINESKDAKPVKSDYKSAMSIPIGEYGVFQAVSTEENYFDEEDMNVAELLINHVTSALKRLEMREREEFLHSLLRHDVRNKSVLVQGYLDLTEKNDLPEEVKEYIKRAKNVTENGIDIIDKVRKLRKIEEKDNIRDVKIKSILDRVILDYEEQMKQNDINMKLEGEDRTVKGGSLLEDLFSNLIENSIQHSNCNRIKMKISSENDECIITIEDNGKGIDDKDKDRIFEKGYNFGEKGGTGLGMYIAKEVAENYNGSVGAADSDLGGARFDIRLKLVD